MVEHAIKEELDAIQRKKAEVLEKIQEASGNVVGTPGCLSLEDSYSVKGDKTYGPYGPYWYRYFYKDGKRTKEYVGRNVSDFAKPSEAYMRLKELEKEYRALLKQERRLNRIIQRVGEA